MFQNDLETRLLLSILNRILTHDSGGAQKFEIRFNLVSYREELKKTPKKPNNNNNNKKLRVTA